MKKLLCLSLAFLALVAATILVAWWNLPRLCSYAISRVASGKAEVREVALSYKDGLFHIDFRDLTMDGQVKGTAKSWKMAVNPRYGLYLTHMAVSGFDLTISDAIKGKKEQYITPIDLLEAKDGVLRYGDQVFAIKELRVDHLRTGKPFQYRIEVSDDKWFGTLKTHGDGLYKGKASEFKGRVTVTGMDMAQWDLLMKGIVNGEGAFTYGKDGFSLDGAFRVAGFELKLSELKEPYFADLSGRAHLTYHGGKTAIQVRDVMFKGTPFSVDIGVKGADIAYVDLSSGEVPVDVVKYHVNLDEIAKGASQAWDYVQDGRVSIRKLSYAPDRPIDIDLQVTAVRAEYHGMAFSDIEGALRFGTKNARVSGVKGRFRESAFTGVSASYTYKDRRLSAAGAYSVSLTDIASIADMADIRDMADLDFKGGIAEGTVSVDAKRGAAPVLSGSGFVRDGDMAWKKTPFSVKGSYRFTGERITFDPLMVSRDGTDLAVSGTWGKTYMDLALKGRLDLAHVRRVQPLPVSAGGIADIDLTINRQDPVLTVTGLIGMDQVSYEAPGLMKKDRGIANTVRLDVAIEGSEVRIKRLRYKLDAIDLDLTGEIRKDRRMDLDVTMKIDGFERVAKIFFVDDDMAKGDADMVMSVRDMDLDSRRIPFMKGYINVNNGFVRLPSVTKPFKEIRLRSVFHGDAFDVQIDRFVCGESLLTGGKLHVEGRDSPRFSLSVAMENLKLADFADEFEFKVGSLPPDGPLAHASGTVSLRAKKVKLAALTVENLVLSGMLADRKLDVSELKVDALGGNADLHGAADFSGPLPRFSAYGRVDNITSYQVLAALHAKTQIIDSTGMAYGSLSSAGEKPADWLYNLDGAITFYSRDGVIKKWNLLSKIFGVLNIYDLVRGKVDLAAEGLPYTKMGASFLVKDGVLQTNNFLIDSPSMLITGAGNIDFRRKEVQGAVTVSPLVAIDTIIDKVPVVRSLLKKKTSGFLYAAYDVKGPLDDPEVSVSFVDTVGGKTLELIKNILTLPIGVFE